MPKHFSRSVAQSWFALFLLVTGSAAANNTLPEKFSHLKRLGVVSLVGQTLHRVYVGLTVFTNELESEPIVEWQLDSHYERQIVEAGTGVGFELVVIPGMRETVAAGVKESKYKIPYTPRSSHYPETAAYLKDMALKHQLDGYIFVLPVKLNDRIGGSNQYLEGLGLYRRGAGETTRWSARYFFATIQVFDRHLVRFADRNVDRSFYRTRGSTEQFVPIELTPSAVTGRPLAALSPDERMALREQFMELPAKHWEATLRRILEK